VVKNLAYSRYWAQQKKVKPLPFPSNVIMEGGTATLEEMIKSTKRGILVTKLGTFALLTRRLYYKQV
jgi:predicted Zn-dependent protease